MNSGVDEPPGRPELQRDAVLHAARQLEELAQRGAERRLVLAGPLDVPGDRVDLRAGALLGAHAPEPVAAAQHDGGHAGDGLDVVDHGGRGVEARGGRERRLEPGLAAAALERVEQRRLLAADVGARAGVHDDVEVVARAEDVACRGSPSRTPRARRWRSRRMRVQRLAAHVDRAEVRADRVAGDDAALDQRVRVGHHRRDVLAGARLALVGVDHEVLGLGAGPGGPLRDEAPLHAGGEARAAAAAQAGVLDQLDQLVGMGRERVREGLVAARAARRCRSTTSAGSASAW